MIKLSEERVLITGCGGMLGEAVYNTFSKKYKYILATDIDLNESWLKYLDVRDLKQCEKIFLEFKPTLVLHLAALTDLEYCELNKEDTWKTNAVGTENIANLCKKYSALMIYIGTAGIFDGKKEFFDDYDIPNPLSSYAKSKYHGEKFVQQCLDKYFIFRAGWMMGGGLKKDKKFIKKIYDQIKSGKKELFIVDDKLGTPTYTLDFAESLYNVIQTGYFGLYNMVCNGDCSRYDTTIEFLKNLNLYDKIKIVKVSSDFFKKQYFALRPFSEKLINLKLNQKNINFMRDWKICLKEYSEIFKKDYYKERI